MKFGLTTWGLLANLLATALYALDIKGRIDALTKNVVYKDVCTTCKEGRDKEISAVHDEMRRLREELTRQHKEQMSLMRTLYLSLPKREDDR